MYPYSSDSLNRTPALDSPGQLVNVPAMQGADGARDVVRATTLAMTPTRMPAIMPPTPTAEERAQIVRLCLRATRDPDTAEDLAQETLLEAWRNWHKLREPDDAEARMRWLATIAGHVAHRWMRASGRDRAHSVRLGEPNDERDASGAGIEGLRADEDELDTTLEHAERAQLLDRALGLLPPETREALIARYLLETPLAEIAARSGLSEATLSVRLHRGKQALRAHLATTLREEALAFGLLPDTDTGWQETRIWCPLCGRAHLRGQLYGSPLHLELRCPACAPGNYFIEHVSFGGILDGAKTFKVALNRVMAWADRYYCDGAIERAVTCRCGRTAPIVQGDLSTRFPWTSPHGLHALCCCQSDNRTDIAGMALFSPIGRRFWHAHPRIHLLPEQTIEQDGREVIVTSYQSANGTERLDTLFARDTYELLSIHCTTRT